jgi:hypothetical protein
MKVEATPDRQYVFAGKQNLKILELLSDKVTLLNKGKNVVSFIDIKNLQSSQFLVHEEPTLDLVFYDSEFNEIKRLPKASNAQNPFHQTNNTIKLGSSQQVYGWFAGNDELRIVNLTNAEYVSVSNFFGNPGQRVLPLAIALSDKEKKAAGLYTIQGNSEVLMSVFTPNGSLNRLTVESVVNQKSRQ